MVTAKITNAEELRDTIRLLEQKKIAEQELLKEEYYFTRERMKPSNVVKSTFNQVFTGPNLLRTIMITALGITAAYISRKYFQGLTGRILKRFLRHIV